MTAPLLVGRPSDAELSDQLLATTWKPRSRLWWPVFAFAAAGTVMLFVAVALTVKVGIGLWGNNIPVAWAFGIINFVWWIGIGHAGTFISAILLLVEQKWRTSINRFAEAMTLFAVMQAGLFPLLHLGRPWFAYWLVPYPATMRVWPNFKSALPWDAAAISTYFIVSLVFWYLGLIPDLAALRDRSPTRRRRIIYGLMALGWRGSVRDWARYRIVYGILAGLSTPLVVSVHSIVSTDFAITLLAGWHSTIFPPFFVAGAIFSGFAMVLTLLIPLRRIFGVENVVTTRHLDALAKMTLVTGWIVIYSYVVEFFVAWYSGEHSEIFQFFHTRPFGPGNGVFWAMMTCNVVVPQLLWSQRIRRSGWPLWIVAILVNVGMWSERFVIIVQGLVQADTPSEWGRYAPRATDICLFAGTGCFFLLLFLAFVRLLPFVPVAEVKELAHEEASGPEGAGA